MKDTKLIKLINRRDKGTFLDTVVFGMVFRTPGTDA